MVKEQMRDLCQIRGGKGRNSLTDECTKQKGKLESLQVYIKKIAWRGDIMAQYFGARY